MKPEDLIRQMNAYYDRRAPDHDRFMSYTDNANMEALLKPIIDIIEPHITDRKVLEIACGTGNWTQVLAKRARSVVATDVNESVLEIARTKPIEGNVTFRAHNAYAVNQLQGDFDVAFAADWWSHIPKSMLSPFLRRLHTALSPGGTIIMLDMTVRDLFRDEPSYIDEDGNRVSLREVDGREYPVIKNFPAESELREMVSEYAASISYHEYDELERWLLICQLKS